VKAKVTASMRRVLKALADGWWVNPPGRTNYSLKYSIEKGFGFKTPTFYTNSSVIEKLTSAGFIERGTLKITPSGLAQLSPSPSPSPRKDEP
jgi:hypothetical protein